MQRFKRTILVFVASAIFATGYAQDSTTRAANETFTLQQCVETAIKNNSTVKQSQFTMEGYKVSYQGALGQMLPFANASINHADFNGRSINPNTNQYINTQNTSATYSLNAQITVWNASSLRNYLAQTKDYYKAGEMDLQQAKDNVTIIIILDYLTVLSDQEQLSVAQASLEATKEQVRVNEVKNEQGAIAPSDYYLLKGTLGTNEVSVTAAKNALEVAKLNLCQDMNINYSNTMSLMPLPDSTVLAPYGSNVDDVYSYALHNLAIVKAADYRLEGAKAQIKSAKGAMYPSLYLFAGLGTNYSSVSQTENLADSALYNTGAFVNPAAGTKYPVYAYNYQYNYANIPYWSQLSNNVNSQIGIGLSIPILNGFNLRNRVKQARITESQYDFNRTTTHILLRQSIEKDYVNMTAAFNTYSSVAKEVDAYNQAFNAAQAQLDAGAINTYTYVIAKNNLDGAKLNQVSTKYNYILQTKILDYYMGRLTY